MLVDDAKEQNLGKCKKVIKEYLINQAQIELYSPWQNRAVFSLAKQSRTRNKRVKETC